MKFRKGIIMKAAEMTMPLSAKAIDTEAVNRNSTRQSHPPIVRRYRKLLEETSEVTAFSTQLNRVETYEGFSSRYGYLLSGYTQPAGTCAV
jgi:hypothetical protein